MPRKLLTIGSAAVLAGPALATAPSPPADYSQLRDTYRELIETDTTLSSGSCTLAAERMAARLKQAGMHALYRERDYLYDLVKALVG
jgi:hypothetical protein